MDCQQAETHLKILKLRVHALEKELKVALEHDKSADERINTLGNAVERIRGTREERLKEIEEKYEVVLAEQTRQIKLAEDMLTKKKEEREALLGYLKELNLMDSPWTDFKDFDWDSLRRAAGNLHKPAVDLVGQHHKAKTLDEYVQRGRSTISELNEALGAIEINKGRVSKTTEEIKSYIKQWIRIRANQEKRINKVQCDNGRLNMLIKQCVANNEPMSEFLTKNVQAKCQSFLKSDSPAELLNGLNKFKSRQDRMIKLLHYKDTQLGSETNKLEVAKDQTQDQLKFYQNMIESRRGSIYTNITAPSVDYLDQNQTPTTATGA